MLTKAYPFPNHLVSNVSFRWAFAHLPRPEAEISSEAAAVFVASVDRGAGRQEPLRHGVVAVPRRPMQRRPASGRSGTAPGDLQAHGGNLLLEEKCSMSPMTICRTCAYEIIRNYLEMKLTTDTKFNLELTQDPHSYFGISLHRPSLSAFDS